MRSMVFGVPILLGLLLIAFLAPETGRSWQMLQSGVPTSGTIRHAGPDVVYLDYEAQGRMYSTGGSQKQGSRWLSLPDGESVRLTYLPSDPQVVELSDPGTGFGTSLVEDVGVVAIMVLWVGFAWLRWLTRKA